MTIRTVLVASVCAAALLVSAGAEAEESKAYDGPFTLRADAGCFFTGSGLPAPSIAVTFGYVWHDLAFEYSTGVNGIPSFWNNTGMARVRVLGSRLGPSHALSIGGGVMLWTHFGVHDDSVKVDNSFGSWRSPAGDKDVGTYAYGLFELGYELRRGPFTFFTALGAKISVGAMNQHHHDFTLDILDLANDDPSHPVMPYTRIGVGVVF